MEEELQEVEEVTAVQTVEVDWQDFIDTSYRYQALHALLEVSILLAVFFVGGCLVAKSFWRR